MKFNSALPGSEWPACPDSEASALLAGLFQLEYSQWLSAEQLRRHQFGQLALLLQHAASHVPFHRERFRAAGVDVTRPLDDGAWARLPLLTRKDIQQAGASLVSGAPLPGQGERYISQTSGSTGEPVKVTKALLSQHWWRIFNLRDHLWHRRDFSGRFAVIRHFEQRAAAPDGELHATWGGAVRSVFASGASMLLDIRTDIPMQARWLLRHNPHYLLTYPSNLRALIAHFEDTRLRLPMLSQVLTVGEIVTPALRADCARILGAPLVDMYTSEEFGYLALQCPEHPHYHVQSENVLVEVLDAEGQPCRAGSIGRLVVTSLNNFAMPLIRYEIGDLAEVGAPCACGRGLPVLGRIIGRSRNLLRLPTGERHWPIVGFRAFRDIAPVRQYQFVQQTLERIDVRLVVERPLTGDEEERLRVHIRQSLGHPFSIALAYVPVLERGKTGKFEEFICALPD